MSEHDRGKHWNRDDEQKPGAPPRTAHEPEGAEESTKTAKTLTDPGSGTPQPGAPAPNRARTDETPPRR
jgi:hypothetical protein